MADYRRYADVCVGDVFPPQPLEFRIEADVVDRFLAATDSCSGGPRRVPSMIASVYLINLLTARRSPPGGIHAKQAIRFHRAVRIGETLSIQAEVVEKYTRKERPYVVSDFRAHGGDGALVASGRITSIWGPDQ